RSARPAGQRPPAAGLGAQALGGQETQHQLLGAGVLGRNGRRGAQRVDRCPPRTGVLAGWSQGGARIRRCGGRKGRDGGVMSDDTGEAYVTAADRALRETYEEPMSRTEYVDRALEDPTIASHASKYLVAAIESMGTREVIEEGEERERYRFFDDPHNDGEHAILGNTEVLNAFVDDLRSIAAQRGKDEKIIWLAGPTATGKSELKRCLINGLREFSKTDAGRRYTVEWNVAGMGDGPGLTYGDEYQNDEDDWYGSPVQSNPLTVFPPEVRAEIVDALNARSDDHIPIVAAGRLDPFCREAYEYL